MELPIRIRYDGCDYTMDFAMSNAPLDDSNSSFDVPELHNGDRMTQREFHSIYERMPANFRAELIGGTVFVSSPLRQPHGQKHLRLGSIFDAYQAFTPGVEACDNTTVILGDADEVQPDLFLRILPECNGQSANTYEEYVTGAPELVAEIAHSSKAIDLHQKRKRYAKAGVLEYIVVCLQPPQIFLYNMKTAQLLKTDDNGVLKSVIFPGLWLHVDALLQMNYQLSMDVLKQGIASTEHEIFVCELAESRR